MPAISHEPGSKPAKLLTATKVALATLCVAVCGCGSKKPTSTSPEITVAAASNLTGVFDEISKAFTNQTCIKVTLSYGSTAQLAHQIENGAPFDVFASADVEHVEGLVQSGKLIADSRGIYGRGLLALWIPNGDALAVNRLEDLTKPTVRFVAIATPSAAPYGRAAVEALQKTSLWSQMGSKVVYSTNINMAKQFAASGNADAALTAYSLVLNERGRVIRIDESLYAPIDQAIAIVTASKKIDLARRFTSYVMADGGRTVLKKYGYLIPRPARAEESGKRF